MTSLLPDLFLLALAFGVLVVDMFMPKKGPEDSAVFTFVWTGLLITIASIFMSFGHGSSNPIGSFVTDDSTLLLRLFFTTSCFFTVLLSRSYFKKGGNLRGSLKHEGEFYALLIFCTFGMFTVVSARDLISLFIGIELSTIPLYALTAFYKDRRSSAEASTKFLVMGSLSTAIGLFGYSYLYGAVGSVGFAELKSFASENPNDLLLWVGVLGLLVSAGFKLAMAPFHMWAPDVYHGSPTPVTAFLSASSKGVAFVFLMALFFGPLAPLLPQLQPLFVLLACLSMSIGNLGAMRQRELRRFMAYSSIGQAGYILMAFLSDSNLAQTAIVYYLFVYLATNFLAFTLISILGQKRDENFSSLRGLSRQSPMLAGLLMLTMFSLAGIPPLAGFTGKFFLFAAAVNEGYYFLVLFAALNSTLSLYYYLLIIKEAYITDAPESLEPLEISLSQRWSLILLGAGVIFLGLLPQVSSSISNILAS